METRMLARDALEVLSSIMFLEKLVIIGSSGEAYRSALSAAEVLELGVNDALAYLAMKENGLTELYSFDRDYDKLGDVKRITM
jgi:predicted nucleic acid-binding protein